MHWRTEPHKPSINERCTEFKFAWMPTELTDGNTVWLEMYEIKKFFNGTEWIVLGTSIYFCPEM